MNRERLEAVAHAIETQTLPGGTPLAFDMRILLSRTADVDAPSKRQVQKAYCAGCIAGFAALMFGRPQDRAYLDQQTRVNIVAVDLIAQAALGLTDDEAGELFYGTTSGVDIRALTAADAARTLHRAATTGDIHHSS